MGSPGPHAADPPSRSAQGPKSPSAATRGEGVGGAPDAPRSLRRISVVIPTRDEAASIGGTVRAVVGQAGPGLEVEVIVVDDGSSDGTAAVARAAGARVLEIPRTAAGGNPAQARNRGAAAAGGDPIVFLDADCFPERGWLRALLSAHEAGAAVVGGALELPPGLSTSARCDYYCGWYHVHARRRPGWVSNHPPTNLSVRRDVFRGTSGFTEAFPAAYAHEELEWQAEAQLAGHGIYFEPRAVAYHRNRPGFGNLLQRNYRWGYSAIEAKARTGAARMAWIYRYPRLLVAASAPLALAGTGYIVGCWLRAGVYEPFRMLPAVLAARIAYSAGMAVGGIHWLRARKDAPSDRRPRWE